ncbi:MAG: pilus assembly protein PilM [Candidatus Omnitrophota bacterium]|nr:pilus assembly protein PilM [Candidatus Omnitrophota bacterium]
MRTPTALEIGDRYIKLVIARTAEREVPLDCFVKSSQGLKDEEITKIIKEMLSKAGRKINSVVVNLPRNLVTMRNLHLPSQDPDEISQMIDLHVGRIVPYKKEEIVFDHLSLRTDSLGYTAQMLAIVHKDVLKRYQRILDAAGIEMENVFLSSYGVWQWASNKFKSQISANDLYLLLDIDSAYTDFIIFDRENILFSRTLAFEVKDVIANSELNKFIGEIKQSLLIFHKNESINKKPSAIFISGISEGNIADAIKKEFDVSVSAIPNPISDSGKLKRLEIPPDLSLTAVANFAVEDKGKRLSFALPEMIVKKSLKEKTKDLTMLGITLFYIFTIIMAFIWAGQYNRQFYLKRLVQRNKLIELDIGNLVDQYKKIGFVKNFIYQRNIPLLLLNEIEKLVPSEIIINYISIEQGNSITLRGQGVKLSDVFKFVTTLENSKYFQDVATKYTRTKKVKDRELTDFEITFIVSLSKKQTAVG